MSLAFAILTAVVGVVTTLVKLIKEKESRDLLTMLALFAFFLSVGTAIASSVSQSKAKVSAIQERDALQAALAKIESELTASKLHNQQIRDELSRAKGELVGLQSVAKRADSYARSISLKASQAQALVDAAKAEKREAQEEAEKHRKRKEEVLAELRKFRAAIREKLSDLSGRLNATIETSKSPDRELLTKLGEDLSALIPPIN